MATASDLRFYYPSKVVASDGGTLTAYAADAGCTTTTIVDAALTQGDDYWNGAVGWFSASTATAALQSRYFHVTDFTASSDTLTLASALPAAPAEGDVYYLALGGGYRSATEVPGLTAAGTVTGVTVDFVGYENGTGSGTLAWTASGTTITWRAPGGTAGATQALSAAGSWVLYDADTDKYVRITGSGTYAGTNETRAVTLTQPEAIFIPHSEAAESTAGKMRSILAVIKNEHASDELTDVKAYTEKAVSAAAATNLAGTLGLVTANVNGSSFSDWPTSGWIHNTTKDDCRYFYSRSGNTITCGAADWCKLAFDGGGTTEIEYGLVVSGSASGAVGTCVCVQLNTAGWAAGTAAGNLYLKNFSGTFADDEVLYVNGTDVGGTAAGTATAGLRDKTAQAWASNDAVELMPDVDLSADAAAGGTLFEAPGDEWQMPAGLSFTCPTSAGTGLDLGTISAGGLYGVWMRETIYDGQRSRQNVISDLRAQFSV